MKRTLILTLAITAVCAATGLYVLADEGGCPEQEFGDLTGYNLEYIAMDPISGKHLRLTETATVTVGVPTVITGWVCDDDATAGRQTLTLTRGDTDEDVPIDLNDFTYEYTVLYQTEGTKFVPLSLSDGLQHRRGTKIIFAVKNRPPILW